MNMFEKLLKIGGEEASLWGGYCKKAEINMDERKVDFLCNEHGEDFYTSLTFEEIKEKYGLVI